MITIAVAAVTAGGKTTVVRELLKLLPNAKSLHFDDYSFEGEVEDFAQWVRDGADYHVWKLDPLARDIRAIRESGACETLILDYPFAYRHRQIAPYIDAAFFIDTPLDVALARRVLRDFGEASAEEIRADLRAYLDFARPAYLQMLKDILPSSDYVIDGLQSPEAIAAEIAAHLQAERSLTMPRDILFKETDFVFSYRVGGILIHKDKILLQRPKGDDYAIIGGHVAALETTEETLRREFREELHADIAVDRLLAVGEVFFPWGSRPCHSICFYYRVSLKDDSIPMDGVFSGYDELGGARIDLDFCWVPLEALRNGTKVYPLALIPHILADRQEIAHFVTHED